MHTFLALLSNVHYNGVLKYFAEEEVKFQKGKVTYLSVTATAQKIRPLTWIPNSKALARFTPMWWDRKIVPKLICMIRHLRVSL